MSKPWISDSKQRRSKKYRAIHDDLRLQLQLDQLARAINTEVSKQKRKRMVSEQFRATGG